ncbi:endonuclease/exonuclease/phosphatase family protein [Halpernia sp. GG3]
MLVCLQELKAPQENFPFKEIIEVGYEAIWVGQKSWNGVAVLSKNIKLKERRRALPGNDSDERADIWKLKQKILFYVPFMFLMEEPPRRAKNMIINSNWLEHFQAQAEILISSGKKIIICGDFNITPLKKMFINQ